MPAAVGSSYSDKRSFAREREMEAAENKTAGISEQGNNRRVAQLICDVLRSNAMYCFVLGAVLFCSVLFCFVALYAVVQCCAMLYSLVLSCVVLCRFLVLCSAVLWLIMLRCLLLCSSTFFCGFVR